MVLGEAYVKNTSFTAAAADLIVTNSVARHVSEPVSISCFDIVVFMDECPYRDECWLCSVYHLEACRHFILERLMDTPQATFLSLVKSRYWLPPVLQLFYPHVNEVLMCSASGDNLDWEGFLGRAGSQPRVLISVSHKLRSHFA